MRLKCRRSRFSRRIMIHMLPHCATCTGSTVQVISLTKVMAPVTWYSARTLRTCSQGHGMFSSSFMIACGTNLSAPRYTRLSVRYLRELMSPWSRTILRRCSTGMSTFSESCAPNFLRSA